MAIKLNSTTITSIKLNTTNITSVKLNGVETFVVLPAGTSLEYLYSSSSIPGTYTELINVGELLYNDYNDITYILWVLSAEGYSPSDFFVNDILVIFNDNYDDFFVYKVI